MAYIPGRWSIAQERREVVRHLSQVLVRRAHWKVFEVGGGEVDDLLLKLRERHQAVCMVSKAYNCAKRRQGIKYDEKIALRTRG